LDDETAKPLIDRGWKRDGDAVAWQGESGTSMLFQWTGEAVRLLVFFQRKHAVAYEMTVAVERAAALAAALAASTAELGRLSHAGFSKAVAGIATDVAVKTTDGHWVRPWLRHGQREWEPIQR